VRGNTAGADDARVATSTVGGVTLDPAFARRSAQPVEGDRGDPSVHGVRDQIAHPVADPPRARSVTFSTVIGPLAATIASAVRTVAEAAVGNRCPRTALNVTATAIDVT
jgi:hypothetical protein